MKMSKMVSDQVRIASTFLSCYSHLVFLAFKKFEAHLDPSVC